MFVFRYVFTVLNAGLHFSHGRSSQQLFISFLLSVESSVTKVVGTTPTEGFLVSYNLLLTRHFTLLYF